MLKIAFIGLGKMGQAIVTRLIAAGFDLTLYNRTKEKALIFARHGVKIADSIQMAVQHADIVISCLFDDDSVLALNKELLLYLPPNSLYVSTETVLPETIKIISKQCAECNIQHVSACSLGVPPAAIKGELTVIFGGNETQSTKLQPIFAAYSKIVLHAGAYPFLANVLKIAANYMLYSAVESMGEVSAYTSEVGLNQENLNNFFHSIYAHPAFLLYANRITKRDFDQANFTMQGCLKDVNLFEQAFLEAGIEPNIIKIVKNNIAKSMGTSYENQDWSALTEVCRVTSKDK